MRTVPDGCADKMDRFKGTLLGCAVGDALGAPVEGISPEALLEIHGRVTDFLDERYGAGRVTDDTQMTVALAQGLIEFGSFNQDHIAFKFGRWMQLSDEGVKEARGVGMASATAARRLYQGAGTHESGVASSGCGAAMRASPVGLRFYYDPDRLLEAAVGQATLTHTNPEAVAGAAAVAFSVSLGVKDLGSLDRARFTSEVSDFVEHIDRGMAERIAGLADYLDARPHEGFAYTGNGGYVMETVPGALFAFLRTPYDLEETIVTAVNAGGDTDSLGSIAGAVSGAFNGASRMPARWLDGVEGREYLEMLAERLFTLTPAVKQKIRPLI